jgi:5-methylcytosine-specific restriction protein A
MPSRIPTHKPRLLAAPDRHREYDRSARDREAKRFYDSAAWKKLRRWKLATDPLCGRCERASRLAPATVVHHLVERSLAPELALDGSNLESLCAPCHSRHHASRPPKGPPTDATPA